MKLNYLIRGLPGHPLHPPLTDATIGAYTVGTALAFASVIGVAETSAAHGWWLALVLGLIFTVPTAASGFAEWLTISSGTPLKRLATVHALVNVTAAALFLIAVIVGHDGYQRGAVEAGPFVLTLLGFGVLTLGGWLGGAITYVHGMRVLNLVEEPAGRAASPVPMPEKERAEGS